MEEVGLPIHNVDHPGIRHLLGNAHAVAQTKNPGEAFLCPSPTNVSKVYERTRLGESGRNVLVFTEGDRKLLFQGFPIAGVIETVKAIIVLISW
jgi:hypothetical protein